MEEGTPPRLAELHAELRGMNYGQLLEKAELVGVDDEALDGAEQEQEVIALIVAQLEEQLAAEEAARVARLKEELGSMKRRALYRKAQQLGVDKQQLDGAKDKAAIIALIAELSLAEASGGTDPGPQPEPEDDPHEPEPEGAPQSETQPGYGLGSRTSSSGLLRMSTGPQGAVQILDTSELQNAIFISYSRRHAGALNATNVIVNALRWRKRADGLPYSRACHSGVLVPWMDKEQMVERGGADWARILTEAQIRSTLSIFFLSNAYCGSDECLKELQFADMEKHERIPVFLEWFVDDDQTYNRQQISKLCDQSMQSFDDFQIASALVKRSMARLQGVPGPLNLSRDFTCEKCRDRRDTVCVCCTDWDTIRETPAWPKLNEMVEVLGKYIDGKSVKNGLLPGGSEPAPVKTAHLAADVQASRPSERDGEPADDASQQAADARMAKEGYYVHFALQTPPVAIGGSAVQATLRERLRDIEDLLQHRQASLMSQKCFPLYLSDASASSCDVEFQLRGGLIHCLVWCAKGIGWESRADADDQTMPTLARIGEIIRGLPVCDAPRVSVVCLQYGAQVAAQQLHEAGVPTVIWLSGVDMLSGKCTAGQASGDPLCAALVCEVVLPTVQRLQHGERAIDIERFVRTELSKLLTNAASTITCGCIGSGIVKPWQPADTASERWLIPLQSRPIERINFDETLDGLQDLSIYACDLERLRDCRVLLQQSNNVMIVSEKGTQHAENRRRAVAATLCTELQECSCGLVVRISSANELQRAPQPSVGYPFIWLDFLGASTAAEDVRDIEQMLTERQTVSSGIVITCDDACSSHTATADAVEHLAEALDCEDVSLDEETGLLDVHADECIDDFKLLALFSNDRNEQVSLLDVFGAPQLANILQAQLRGHPVVAIYHADEMNGILVRVAVSDVAFLHWIRDQFLQDIFGRELAKALSGVTRKERFEKKSLGDISIKINQSHFAEQYYSSILRLSTLTAHQRTQLDKVRSTDKSVHVKAPAGAGKTFIALQMMLEVLRSPDSNTALFVAPTAGLVFFVVRWIAERVGGREPKTRKVNRLLSRLHLLFTPFNAPSVATIKGDFIQTRPEEKCPDYALVVIDEAHHIFRDERLRTAVEAYAGARRILLSDVSQGLHDGLPFPDDLQDIHLEEVVRCSKRVVGAAGRFQPVDTSARCHHNSDGPPLKSFLYDGDSNADVAAKFELCAKHTIRAVEDVTSTFSSLNLNNRLAIVVPDAVFRNQLAGPLERQLSAVYGDRFEMLDAVQASRICVLTGGTGTASRYGKEKIIMDEVSQLDGTEFLIVVCVGLDTQMGRIDSSDEALGAAFAESRSRLYRGITRAHMLVLAVNEFVSGGWLEYLTTIRWKKDIVQGHRAPGMSKEQRSRLDADKKRIKERRLKAEMFMQQKTLSAEIGPEELAFLQQKIDAAASHSEQDLDAIFAHARSVEWPLQQQLDRIPRLIADAKTAAGDPTAAGAIRNMATVLISDHRDMTAEQAVESALSSWEEVDTSLRRLIADMGIIVMDAQRSSMQKQVAFALTQSAGYGSLAVQAAAREALEHWVLNGKIQEAATLLKQQALVGQVRPLQPIVSDNVRQGMTTNDAVSAALALWAAVDTALQALAQQQQITDQQEWVQVGHIVKSCVGLQDDALAAAVANGVRNWTERKRQDLEALKEEQTIWDSRGNDTTRIASRESRVLAGTTMLPESEAAVMAELHRNPAPFRTWYAKFRDAKAKVDSGWQEEFVDPWAADITTMLYYEYGSHCVGGGRDLVAPVQCSKCGCVDMYGLCEESFHVSEPSVKSVNYMFACGAIQTTRDESSGNKDSAEMGTCHFAGCGVSIGGWIGSWLRADHSVWHQVELLLKTEAQRQKLATVGSTDWPTAAELVNRCLASHTAVEQVVEQAVNAWQERQTRLREQKTAQSVWDPQGNDSDGTQNPGSLRASFVGEHILWSKRGDEYKSECLVTLSVDGSCKLEAVDAAWDSQWGGGGYECALVGTWQPEQAGVVIVWSSGSSKSVGLGSSPEDTCPADGNAGSVAGTTHRRDGITLWLWPYPSSFPHTERYSRADLKLSAEAASEPGEVEPPREPEPELAAPAQTLTEEMASVVAKVQAVRESKASESDFEQAVALLKAAIEADKKAGGKQEAALSYLAAANAIAAVNADPKATAKQKAGLAKKLPAMDTRIAFSMQQNSQVFAAGWCALQGNGGLVFVDELKRMDLTEATAAAEKCTAELEGGLEAAWKRQAAA